MMAKILLLLLLSLAGLEGLFGQSASIDTVRGESSMTYELRHPLHEIKATSSEVAYRVILDVVGKHITSVEADVDVMTFNSGNSNRDSHAMEVIDAITYPEANFASTLIAERGDTLMVTGTLNFHGISRPVDATGTAEWMPGKVEVHERFCVSLTDFQIDRPSLLMIPVEDTLRFSLQAVINLNK